MKLISKDLINLNNGLHKDGLYNGPWADQGDRWIPTICQLTKTKGLRTINTILDYGCGTGKFKRSVYKSWRGFFKDVGIIHEYDPCMKHRDKIPLESYDLIVCTDVLEHVDYPFIDNVLDHIYSLMNKCGFFSISLTESRNLFRDGSNTHRIIEPKEWWIWKFRQHRMAVYELDFSNDKNFICYVKKRSENKMTLISDEYRQLNQERHENTPDGRAPYGHTGHIWIPIIEWFVQQKNAKIETILDYGCGAGYFKSAVAKLPQNSFKGIKIIEYDPCIPGKDILPIQADIVVCTDVLEHIEPEYIDETLDFIYDLILKLGFLSISLVPGGTPLPDGSNPHRIIESKKWWWSKLEQHYFKVFEINLDIKHQFICMIKRAH